MTINLSELIPILASIGTVASVLYAFSSNISNREKRIDLKLAEIDSKLDMHEYKIHGCYESLNHKASRLMDEIKDLERKLDDLNRHE